MAGMKGPALGILALAAMALGCSGGPAATAGDALRARESMVAEVSRRDWRGQGLEGVAYTTSHYQVLTTSQSRLITQTLPGFLEACYRQYTRLTALPEPQKAAQMTVYMMGSRREWELLTRKILGDDAPHLMITVGGYCHRNVCIFWHEPQAGPSLWRVAAHEGMHQYLGARMRDSLPMWAEEGLATCAEGHQIDVSANAVSFDPRDNPPRMTALQRTFSARQWIPLDDLLAMDAAHAIGHGPYRSGAYYAQLWALITFLRSDSRYGENFQRMLADAAAGRMREAMGMIDWPAEAMGTRAYNQRMGPLSFRRYIADDLEAFEVEYRRFAQQLAGYR